MSRLIDADALKATITVDGYEHFSGCLSSSEVSLLEMVTDDIDEAPTIDAVTVVWCKDCARCVMYKGVPFCNKWRTFPEIELDDFCSYGEPKEGDE